MSDPRKNGNARTGWILASVALVFFVGVFVRHIWLG